MRELLRIEELENLGALFEARAGCVVVIIFDLERILGEWSFLIRAWMNSH